MREGLFLGFGGSKLSEHYGLSSSTSPSYHRREQKNIGVPSFAQDDEKSGHVLANLVEAELPEQPHASLSPEILASAKKTTSKTAGETRALDSLDTVTWLDVFHVIF